MQRAKRILLAILIIGRFGLGSDLKEKKNLDLENFAALKEKYHNYSKLFTPDAALKTDCSRIQKRFVEIDEEIRQGNLSLIKEHIAKVDLELDRAYAAFKERQKNVPLAFFISIANLGLIHMSIPILPDTTGPHTSSQPTEGGETNSDPCREKQDMFYWGYRAESENRFAEALRQYIAFLDSDCAFGDDGEHARKFIAARRQYLKEYIESLAATNSTPLMAQDIPDILVEMELVAKTDPAWAAPLLKSVKRAAVQSGSKTDFPPAERELTIINKPQIVPIEKTPGMPLAAAESKLYSLSMDVWQSAWGDFSDIDTLLEYLRSNRIHQINFNPGLGIDAKSLESSKKKLADLIGKVMGAGIERVNLLYAELAYPIDNYARLLRENPSLKIDTIIDDSEFTDRNRAGFERNLAAVKKWGIRYGAFVTLESVGNSGVSEATRYWALENIDFPILMSYFSCELDSQKAILRKYLDYADGIGRRGTVGIAILLGSKHVGREISCEKLLSGAQLRLFLSQLHAWCSTHPSYGGLIIETNQRLPRWPVAIDEPK